jgi:hypothetical protein
MDAPEYFQFCFSAARRRSIVAALTGFKNSLLAVILLTGCKSASLSSCVSPCVTGRVVAADGGQPLTDARIRRVNPGASQAEEPARGGQLMAQSPSVYTDQQGNFTLGAEMALMPPFIHRDWYSVTLSIEHDGYLPLQTNFTTINVNGRTPEGAPMVTAGDIRLKTAHH